MVKRRCLMKLHPDVVAKLTLLNSFFCVVILSLLLADFFERPATEESLTRDSSAKPANFSIQQQSSSSGGASDAPASDQSVVIPGSRKGRAQSGLAVFIESTVDPLRSAAADYEEEVDPYLPSNEELSAALASDELDSPETLLVLERLKTGYVHFNMPFPSINGLDLESAAAVEEGEVRRVRNWIVPTTDRLIREMEARELMSEDYVPSEREVTAAINSGAFESQECRAVVDKLRAGYGVIQMEFPEYGSVEPPPVNTLSTSEAEKEVMRVYFAAQVRRLGRESSKKSVDISDCLPSEESIEQAVATGALTSAPAQSMLDTIQRCYEKLEIPFQPPNLAQE
jgi:hypothetical protein